MFFHQYFARLFFGAKKHIKRQKKANANLLRSISIKFDGQNYFKNLICRLSDKFVKSYTSYNILQIDKNLLASHFLKDTCNSLVSNKSFLTCCSKLVLNFHCFFNLCFEVVINKKKMCKKFS